MLEANPDIKKVAARSKFGVKLVVSLLQQDEPYWA